MFFTNIFILLTLLFLVLAILSLVIPQKTAKLIPKKILKRPTRFATFSRYIILVILAFIACGVTLPRDYEQGESTTSQEHIIEEENTVQPKGDIFVVDANASTSSMDNSFAETLKNILILAIIIAGFAYYFKNKDKWQQKKDRVKREKEVREREIKNKQEIEKQTIRSKFIKELTQSPKALDGFDCSDSELEKYISKLIEERTQLGVLQKIIFTPDLRKLDYIQQKLANRHLEILDESIKIIIPSQKYDTILSRYSVIKDNLQSLDREFDISNTKDVLELVNLLEPQVSSVAYIRQIRALRVKIDSLKTEKAKQKYYQEIEVAIENIKKTKYLPKEEVNALRRYVKLNNSN